MDDHEDDRVLLEQLFKSHGYQVLLATNGEVAYEIIKTKDIDLVISDVLMPIMDGLQLCRLIKTNNDLKQTPVILYTSIYSNEDDMMQAIKVGADHYLIKPIDPEEVLEIIEKLFDKNVSIAVPEDNGAATTSENKEQYLGLYSSQLVQRLEDEVGKLNAEIIKRKEIEKELYLSNDRLSLYRKKSPLAIIEWDSAAKIVDWNDSAERIFGYDTNETKDLSLLSFFVLDGVVSNAEQVWDAFLSQAKEESNIHMNLTKERRSILCEWHNSIIKDKSGKVERVISIVHDITSQQEAKQKLIDKENEKSEILNTMMDGVVTIDEVGKVLTFNKAAESLFGYDAEDIIGENVKLLMPEPYSKKHDYYLQRYRRTGKAHILGAGTGREVEGLRKNKEIFPLRLLIAELPRDAEGRQRFIGSCQDLTYIKQQEEQLRRSQKMEALGKLTGGIAHDYNNMLGVVLGYTELLAAAVSEQPKLVKYIYEIQRAGERGISLTKKLLSFSRQKTSDAEELDINTLLREELHMLKKTLTARIQLTLNLDDGLWPVYLNSNEFEDAIINISINAMHAINRQGEFTIQTSNTVLNEIDARLLQLPVGDYVLVSLVDTGCGMDELTKEKIFEPFYSTKGDKGTGLGLSQVYGFVKRSKGVIKVYSELKHGTRLSLYFPRYSGEGGSKSSVEESSDNLTGTENILLVDDEPALLKLTAEILGLQGYHVICANNGIQALQLLEKMPIDLMFSDVIMPEMDGYQLAAAVQEKYPHIKIQLASGFSDGRHLTMMDDKLHKKLLGKPYNSKIMLKRIRELLDNK